MINPIRRWHPVGGRATDAILTARLPNDQIGRARVKAEALDILARCPAPGEPNRRETGLSLGYIQSGKTLNYIALTSLARENGYPLVIAMTGTSVPLFEQSTRAMQEALEQGGRRGYLFVENPTVEAATMLQTTLDAWRHPDPNLPRQTAMLTVMKHPGRIDALSRLLGTLQMAGITALVIDDEADQASLNTRVRQDEISATYRSIRDLRAALWSHAYVQYTATPQALLLVSIVDQLSPRFVKVLTPGDDYVGGKTFFDSIENPFVGIIPDNDIPGPQNVLGGPPSSLLDALARFFIGVAEAYRRGDTESLNRSMMIHPSRLVEDHADYYEWVSDVSQNWSRILDAGSGGERDVLLERFRKAHADIAGTSLGLSGFDELVPTLGFAIAQTLVHRVNAANGRTPTINWGNRYAHILVGGQAMDRGFVVEGLTVTYMPRGRGVGNADTLQQRARFFGYKANIKGFCRVYLETNVRDAMVAYVRHEEDVRASLAELDQTDTPVTAWRRRFVLSPLMNMTRGNIHDIPVVRISSATTGWNWTRFAYITEDTVQDNQAVFETFRTTHGVTTKSWDHDVYEGVLLADLRNQLLADYRTAQPFDTARFVAIRERIDQLLEATPNIVADVYWMNNREFRSATAGKGIDNIFQGRGRSTDYPGDRSIFTRERITVQLHVIDVYVDEDKVGTKVPVVAVRFPEVYVGEVLVQPGNNEA